MVCGHSYLCWYRARTCGIGTKLDLRKSEASNHDRGWLNYTSHGYMAQGSIGIRSYSPHTPTEFCDGSLRQGRDAMPRSDRHARTVDSVGAGRYVARNPLRILRRFDNGLPTCLAALELCAGWKVSVGGTALASRRRHDPQARCRRLPAVFAQSQPQDRPA